MKIEALRKLLANAGYQVLQNDDLGNTDGRAWTEMGTFDSFGHQYGWRLAKHVPDEIARLVRRIKSLLDEGWKQVMVVTDHGWLLLLGGLPKAELPEHLTHLRKGRCAQLKDGVQTDQQTVPWYWNNEVRVALAPNICCYKAGQDYEHGGLSPQECFVPVIAISNQNSTKAKPVTIKNVTWSGQRCRMVVSGILPGMKVDIRTKAGDATTSLIETPAIPAPDGKVSVLVENDEKEGLSALIVVLKSDGTVSKQISTIVGGE